jgi:archaellum biogenesis ATPase FlaH
MCVHFLKVKHRSEREKRKLKRMAKSDRKVKCNFVLIDAVTLFFVQLRVMIQSPFYAECVTPDVI